MVALKIPRPGTLVDASDTERFLREARSVARLHHPGIVALHEIGQAPDGACFLVEEFIRGQTLAQLLARGSRPQREAAELLMQVAQALLADRALLDVLAQLVQLRPADLAQTQADQLLRIGTGDRWSHRMLSGCATSIKRHGVTFPKVDVAEAANGYTEGILLHREQP